MTFDSRERSRYAGQPVYFYAFQRGGISRRYCTAARDLVLDGDTYTAAGISSTSIRDSVEVSKNNVTITLPITLDIVAWWHPFPPSQRVLVTIREAHVGDSGIATKWYGRVISPTRSDSLLTLICEPSFSSSRRTGQQKKWCRGCPLAVYSQGIGQCNVSKAAHSASGTLTAISELSLTASAFASFPDGRLAGGSFQWTRTDGLVEARSITGHAGNVITINYGSDDIEVGLAVVVSAGCQGTYADCTTYFSNGINFGGCKFLPVKNPMNGSPIW